MEHVRYVTVKQEQPQKLFTNHFSLKHDNNLQKLQRSNRTQNNSRNPARNQNRKVQTRDNLFA